MSVVTFIHAAEVSRAATMSRLSADAPGFAARHELLSGIVDPSATDFAGDERDYAVLRDAVRSALRGDEARVVLSCSVYNGFAPRLSGDLGVPVERSDDAGAIAALAFGDAIGLAISYPPSLPVVRDHLEDLARAEGRDVAVRSVLSGNAFAAADDTHRYESVLRDASRRARDIDVLYLAQFSMDPYAAQIAAKSRVPVVSALAECVARLVR
jgi:hypothetical protein